MVGRAISASALLTLVATSRARYRSIILVVWFFLYCDSGCSLDKHALEFLQRVLGL
ncbi:30488_t:CDS:2, partial [Racocetra persica]